MLGLLYPLHMINLNALQALGRSDLFLRLELIKKLLVVVNIAITWRWGISAIIYGMIATSIVSYYLNSYYTERLIGYSLKEQLRDMTSYLVTSLLMGVAVYLVGIQTTHVSWPALLLQFLVGMVSYVCLCRIFRLAAFMELWQELWNGLPFRSETAS
jgi:O-antigen/teichoic acid export membrane protein